MKLGTENGNTLYLLMHRQITGSDGKHRYELAHLCDGGEMLAHTGCERTRLAQGPVTRQSVLRILPIPAGFDSGATQHG